MNILNISETADFPTQPSVGFRETGLKRKYPLSSTSLDKDFLLMLEVRGEEPDSFHLTGRQC